MEEHSREERAGGSGGGDDSTMMFGFLLQLSILSKYIIIISQLYSHCFNIAGRATLQSSELQRVLSVATTIY